MFDNFNNGNIQQKNDSVNTRGPQFKNSKGFEVATLVVGYWDDKVNLTLHPKLKNPSEKQVYDYETKIMVTLRVDKAAALLKSLEKVIDKAIEEKKEKSVGVTTGNNNMAVVSTIIKEDSLYVVLHVCRELNVETRIPNQRYSYTFIKDDQVVEDYDPSTGKFENIIEVQTEYECFIEMLREFIRINQVADVHSDKYFNKYYRDNIYSNVLKTGLKVGALDSGNHNSMFSNSFNPNGNKPQEDLNQNTTQQATLSDLQDIL